MKRKNTGEALMTRQVLLREISSVNRRQPLLGNQDFYSRRRRPRPTSCPCGRSRFAEVVGGTTADCAAVCCCGPCGLVNLLVLAVYKLPAGLYKKALRKKRRRRLLKNGIVLPRSEWGCDCDEQELLFRSSSMPMVMVNGLQSDEDVLALEEEMWDKFYSSGFWRSSSFSDTE